MRQQAKRAVEGSGRRRAGAAGIALVDIMVVAGAAVLVLVLSAPDYQRALMRGDAEEIREDLKAIERAMAEAAGALDLGPGDTLSFEKLAPFVRGRDALRGSGVDVFGNPYGVQRVATPPAVPAASFERLKPVADEAFWQPFRVPEAQAATRGDGGTFEG